MSLWTVGKVLDWAAADFRARKLDQPRLEAELLLSHTLGCSRIELYTGFDRPLDQAELGAYREVITSRRQGRSAAHIIGQKEFWSLTFDIDTHVLSPRPETETLVEAALERVTEGPVLDLCTGSGCVALSIAHERKTVVVDAQDISEKALAVARKNVEKHGLADRVRLFGGDLFESLPGDRKYEIITANPPYIPDADMAQLPPEVKAEPPIALCGGPDGLDVIRRILAGAGDFLLPGGWLLMEVDYRQAGALLEEVGPSTLGVAGEAIADLSGRDRVVAWQISQSEK